MTSRLKRCHARPGFSRLGMAFLLGLCLSVVGCGGAKESPKTTKSETATPVSPPPKPLDPPTKVAGPDVTEKVEPAPVPVVSPPAVPPPSEKAPENVEQRLTPVAALQKLGATIDYGSGDRLIDVDLDGKPVTDADLDHLAKLADLKILNLSGSRITDAGLAKLASLKRLKFLYLFKTDITDAGLAHLKELPRLEVLCLDQTLITDDGVKSLEALPRLEKLHVHSRAPLTDASIESLSKHVRLFELKIGGPGFTEKGIARLREALPNCTVQYDPRTEATEG